MALPRDVLDYHAKLLPGDREICEALAKAIGAGLAKEEGVECKVWHGHPVWFLEGNPVVGYSRLKGDGGCVRLLFWSGRSFDEPGLEPEGTFQAAEARFKEVGEVSAKDLKRWVKKSVEIQWDYKNLAKRKGRLERLK